ncbi:MAG TPA: zinc metallopeptidase [Anaerolineaceae bacterium]|nr:MAG: peptidase membrane zinc metallopeptidase putative [Anaerolineaceae bacterium 46_22]HAF47801.1 zinc metallopeptidase [Anaerolineaceae bacterium]
MFLPMFNINYLIYMLPALILSLIAQFYINSRYAHWGQVRNRAGLTGEQVAQRLSERLGMYDLKLKGVQGKLTDHYDPRNNVLSLSRDIAQGPTVASMAITAHELGHAQQDKENYLPMKIRSAMVPAVNIGTSLGWILILIGLLLNLGNLAWLGVFAFSAGAIFSIATLPVELNASKRAKNMLAQSGIIQSEEERKGVSQVLNAAALTYVAAIASSVMQLLYFASLAGGGRRRG